MRILVILSVVLLAAAGAQGQQMSPVVDAQGDAQDTFGQGGPLHDIDTVDVWYDDINLHFRTSFWNEISAPHEEDPTTAIYGFFEIDVDSNPATGHSSIHDIPSFGFGTVLPGSEYYLDFSFTEGEHPNQINLCEYTSPTAIGLVDVVYGEDYIEGSIPLIMIGGDDGLVDFTWMAGNGPQPTDGLSVYGMSRPVPEPATIALLLFGSVALWRRR